MEDTSFLVFEGGESHSSGISYPSHCLTNRSPSTKAYRQCAVHVVASALQTDLNRSVILGLKVVRHGLLPNIDRWIA